MAQTRKLQLNEDIYEEIILMLPLPDALSLLLVRLSAQLR